MRLVGRTRHVTDDDLGIGGSLRLVTVDGLDPQEVRHTKDVRRALDLARPAYTALEAAGLRGEVDLVLGPRGDETDGEVHLDAGGTLRLSVWGDGDLDIGVVRDDVVHGRGMLDAAELVHPAAAERARHELLVAMSSALVEEGAARVDVPAPLTLTDGNLQRLEATDRSRARWCVLVFVTREHEVPEDADEAARRKLWIEHTVGVKLHLDGTVASDTLDDDPDGERSRASLATAEEWAGQPVDLLPFARWLADQTQKRLGLRAPGLWPATDA
ncbi:hypothetical protein J4G33_15200 [Actinotalea sp. BY-33]|uniref:Uncharacterized protein n=1 Tax=Actinotalea soli TaxID=2819234 RepID=A0A939LRE2_9CELL|nr:hypothetical protein [Actinotalea soli]MBO1753156.1 hypothetical protein [Actinotalea soli]